MRKTTKKELIFYTLFIIASVVMAYLLYLLEQDSYNFTWFWLTLLGVIAFFTLFGFIIRFDKKPVPFVCLFPILVIIALFALDYSKIGFYYGTIIATEIIFLLCKAKEYYHIFFTEGYVTEREKREKQKKPKLVMPSINNHADEFSFNSSIVKPYSSGGLASSKTKEINLRGETISFGYNLEPNESEYVLYLGRAFFNPGDREDMFDEFGSDDTTGNVVSICDNHVFEDDYSNVRYFDLNDVEKVKLVTEYGDYITYYFEFTFKDGKEHCFYTDDYDMENIKNCILSARRDLKVIDKSRFISQEDKFSIENNNLEVKLTFEGEVTNTINIDLTKVVNKEILGDDAILYMDDGKEVELCTLDAELLEKLK